MPAKPLIQCLKQLFFERQALITQYPICGMQPMVQGFLNCGAKNRIFIFKMKINPLT